MEFGIKSFKEAVVLSRYFFEISIDSWIFLIVFK